jgi:EAL domain-containing protein (putative c-di-GMP-specific phosphodiesterase class I)
MAAALNYEVVAEGVETEEEAEFLRRRGCPIAQGFLFSAAQPPDLYLSMLREGVIAPRKPGGGALDPAA